MPRGQKQTAPLGDTIKVAYVSGEPFMAMNAAAIKLVLMLAARRLGPKRAMRMITPVLTTTAEDAIAQDVAVALLGGREAWERAPNVVRVTAIQIGEQAVALAKETGLWAARVGS
jgi:enoyl-CoA hydratase/carnithine racemase